MTPDELNDPEAAWPQYTLGTLGASGCDVQCVLLHDSPPDQESINVVLLDDFICTLSGRVIEIQRHQFRPICENGYL